MARSRIEIVLASGVRVIVEEDVAPPLWHGSSARSTDDDDPDSERRAVWLRPGHGHAQGFDAGVLVQETLKRNPHGGHLFVFRVGAAA